jgi:hypothetical protein
MKTGVTVLTAPLLLCFISPVFTFDTNCLGKGSRISSMDQGGQGYEPFLLVYYPVKYSQTLYSFMSYLTILSLSQTTNVTL